MAVSTRSPAPCARVEPEARDVGRELVYELVFRAPASALVPILARARLRPAAVVLTNTAAGLSAALSLADGRLILAALLLQLKTLLDNVDGSLARATDSVTLSGRYLDTEADFVVNVALFVALGSVTGSPLLAAAAFVVLTLVLSTNFQLRKLHRESGGRAGGSPPSSGGRVELALAFVYRVVFAPQDRLLRALSRRRFQRLVERAPDATPEQRLSAQRAYDDRRTVDLVANLGLSTQLAALGLCLLVGLPELYLWLVYASLGVILAAQARRERQARRVLGGLG